MIGEKRREEGRGGQSHDVAVLCLVGWSPHYRTMREGVA